MTVLVGVETVEDGVDACRAAGSLFPVARLARNSPTVCVSLSAVLGSNSSIRVDTGAQVGVGDVRQGELIQAIVERDSTARIGSIVHALVGILTLVS